MTPIFDLFLLVIADLSFIFLILSFGLLFSITNFLCLSLGWSGLFSLLSDKTYVNYPSNSPIIITFVYLLFNSFKNL